MSSEYVDVCCMNSEWFMYIQKIMMFKYSGQTRQPNQTNPDNQKAAPTSLEYNMITCAFRDSMFHYHVLVPFFTQASKSFISSYINLDTSSLNGKVQSLFEGWTSDAFLHHTVSLSPCPYARVGLLRCLSSGIIPTTRRSPVMWCHKMSWCILADLCALFEGTWIPDSRYRLLWHKDLRAMPWYLKVKCFHLL